MGEDTTSTMQPSKSAVSLFLLRSLRKTPSFYCRARGHRGQFYGSLVCVLIHARILEECYINCHLLKPRMFHRKIQGVAPPDAWKGLATPGLHSLTATAAAPFAGGPSSAATPRDFTPVCHGPRPWLLPEFLCRPPVLYHAPARTSLPSGGQAYLRFIPVPSQFLPPGPVHSR